MADLIRNRSSDGNGAAVPHHGGTVTACCWGTFGGATVAVEYSPDGVEWFALPDASFTAKGLVNAQLTQGWLRATVSDAGPSTSVTVVI